MDISKENKMDVVKRLLDRTNVLIYNLEVQMRVANKMESSGTAGQLSLEKRISRLILKIDSAAVIFTSRSSACIFSIIFSTNERKGVFTDFSYLFLF